MSEGDGGKEASPPQRAQAFMGRADIAIAGQQNAEALRFMQQAVDLVPQNKKVRVTAAELALKLRDYQAAQLHTKKLFELAPEDADGIIMMARAKMGARD